MTEPLNDSLKKIARGAGITMVGTVIGLLFGFIARLIIARYGLEANYGIFSLALVVLTFATMLACLGLQQGATRYIAYFRGKEETAKARGTIAVSLQLATAASIIILISRFFIWLSSCATTPSSSCLFSFWIAPVVTATEACSGSLPVANALIAGSFITYIFGFGIPAAIESPSTTFIKWACSGFFASFAFYLLPLDLF